MRDFKSIWKNSLKFNWQFGLGLILLFGIPRFIIVLNANRTGNYRLTSIIFLLMWITPFVLLTKKGRSVIGIKKPDNFTWLLYSFLLGMGACTLVYYFGEGLYQYSISNWFVYISKSYNVPTNDLEGADKTIYFLILAFMGMTFSPIGEELLYRGLIHQSFVPRFGENYASIIDSAAFGITHLAHFGIIYMAGTWSFLSMPAILWVLLMFNQQNIFLLQI